MELLISIIGLTALFSMFIGTAIALVVVGWGYAFTVFIASALVLAFALIMSDIVKQ